MFTRNDSPKLIIFLVFIVLALYHLWTFNHYPPFFPDDGLTASRVKSFLDTGRPFGELESALMSQIPDAEKLYGILPSYLYSLPVVIYGEINLTSIRFINVIFIFFLLVIVFLIAKEIKDWKIGILAMIFLGLSSIFSFVTHIARPDVLAVVPAMLALYLTLLARNQKFYLFDYLAGIVLIVGYDIHPRAIVFAPIIVLLYFFQIIENRQLSLRVVRFIFALLSVGACYYLMKIFPYQEAHALLLKASVGSSRTPPLLLFDFSLILDSFNQLVSVIKRENWAFVMLLTLGLVLPLINRVQYPRFATYLLISVCVSTASIFHGVNDLNVIIVLPIFAIIGAITFGHIFNSCFTSFVRQFLWRTVLIVIVGIYGVSNISKATKFMSMGERCFQDMSRFKQATSEIIEPNASILGEEIFWFSFPNNHLYSWKDILSLRRLNNYSFAEAILEIKPDYFIFDGGMRYYIEATDLDSAWRNKIVLYTDELNNFFGKYGTNLGTQQNECHHFFTLYKINYKSDSKP